MNSRRELKVGIVGHGFVGKATDWGFSKRTNKLIIDPIYDTNIQQLSKFKPDLIFVCVPTPMCNNGVQDSSIIESVVEEITIQCNDSIVVIKSTVLPSTLKKLEKFNKDLIYNPEFLREKNAKNDFMNAEMIILGGKKNIAKKVSKFYLDHSRCKTRDHIFMDIASASLLKYTVNTFLASKVIFFNEIYDIFEKIGIDDSWELFINALVRDKRIGKSHMDVPGHDGKKGFGGACFPKDSLALVKFAQNIGLELDVLKSVIRKNNEIRSQYDSLDDREKQQNISFDDKI